MSEKWSDPKGFFASPARLTLDRILIMDYLLSHGIVPADLEYPPTEQAAALLPEACQFARKSLEGIEPTIAFSRYRPVKFSQN